VRVCDDLKFFNNSGEYLQLVKRDEEAQGEVSCFMYDLQVSRGSVRCLARSITNHNLPCLVYTLACRGSHLA
jgi:hypothetical protein